MASRSNPSQFSPADDHLPERPGTTYEEKLGTNEGPQRIGHAQAFEGLADQRPYSDAFVSGLASAYHHQHGGYGLQGQVRPGSNTAPMAPAPIVPERQGQIYEAQIAGQADGRNRLGAIDPPPTWDYVDDPQLGSFAYGTTSTQAGPSLERPGNTYQAKIAGEGGRRPNRATVRD